MRYFGWSPPVFLFPTLSGPLPILWVLSQGYQPKLVSPSLSCVMVSFSSLARSWYSFRFLLSFNFSLVSYYLCLFVCYYYYYYDYLRVFFFYSSVNWCCLIDWGCRIHWLHFYRGTRPPANECPVYDTKQSDGEAPVILEFWHLTVCKQNLYLY